MTDGDHDARRALPAAAPRPHDGTAAPRLRSTDRERAAATLEFARRMPDLRAPRGRRAARPPASIGSLTSGVSGPRGRDAQFTFSVRASVSLGAPVTEIDKRPLTG